LFLDGIETGQKIAVHVRRQFRTFDPVDIQQLIHNAGQGGLFLSWKRWFFRADSQLGRRRISVEALVRPESEFFFGYASRTVDVVSGVPGAA
jgi:hypothetical protein